jgi:glycosyltransferase involved in cell wall biosynthesis
MAFDQRDPAESKVVVVMPADNAVRTPRITYESILQHSVHQVILVDDDSTGGTVEIARERSEEAPVSEKYFPEASSPRFIDSAVYGVSILHLLCRYAFHRVSLLKEQQFQNFRAGYRRVE